ncbi:hypothetical protein AX766_09450 [Flavobacterium covae]|nr:hypothetical protein AX766_09450 [Flavobacterium covae]
MPKNIVKDGSVDYTNIIQKILDTNKIVVFPDFPVLINERGLEILSHSRLFFQKKSKLILKPNKLGQYEMLRIHNCEDVEIYNPILIGDREKHLSDSGEWGMGISIRGSKNIIIYGADVSKCWGDGIYLGVTEQLSNNVNVGIFNSCLDFNRRNGMSIIAGENVNVKGLWVTNTSGTPPYAGIDIEPDKPTDILRNLNFENIVSINNKDHGFLIALSNLYGINQKEVNIAIKNLIVKKTSYGLSFKIGNENLELAKPTGTINVEGVLFENVQIADYFSYEENSNSIFRLNLKVNSNQAKNIDHLQKSFANVKNVKIFESY